MVSEIIPLNLTVNYEGHTGAALVTIDSTALFMVLSVTLQLVTNSEVAVVHGDFLRNNQFLIPHQNSFRLCAAVTYYFNKTFDCTPSALITSHNLTVLNLKQDEVYETVSMKATGV